MASRLIKEALDAGKITAYDSSSAPRLMRYLPYRLRRQMSLDGKFGKG